MSKKRRKKNTESVAKKPKGKPVSISLAACESNRELCKQTAISTAGDGYDNIKQKIAASR